MKPTNNKKIIAAAEQFMRDKKINQSDMARLMKCSPATISQLLKDDYSGDNKFWMQQLARCIDFQDETKWRIIRTQNHEMVRDLCLEAQEDSRMMAFTGNTGMGKTVALKSYVNKTENCFYVLADVNMKKKDFINAILLAMCIDEAGTVSEKIDAIVNRLNSLSNPLLVIDDCGKFAVGTRGNFYQIQLIYDRTKGNCGIVLAGMPVLKSFISKMCAKDVAGFRELQRRIAYWMPLRDVERNMIVKAAELFGLDDSKAINWIANKSTNYGDVENILVAYNKAKLKYPGVGTDLEILEALHVK